MDIFYMNQSVEKQTSGQMKTEGQRGREGLCPLPSTPICGSTRDPHPLPCSGESHSKWGLGAPGGWPGGARSISSFLLSPNQSP